MELSAYFCPLFLSFSPPASYSLLLFGSLCILTSRSMVPIANCPLVSYFSMILLHILLQLQWSQRPNFYSWPANSILLSLLFSWHEPSRTPIVCFVFLISRTLYCFFFFSQHQLSSPLTIFFSHPAPAVPLSQFSALYNQGFTILYILKWLNISQKEYGHGSLPHLLTERILL